MEGVVTPATEPLTLAEQEALLTCEHEIERGLNTFYQVGDALAEIRDRRLYRELYGTFEAYCRERWGMARQHAYRLIGAAMVVGNLSPIGDTLPANESVVRPLARLDPEQQPVAWQLAVETAPNGKPTAAHVAEVVDQLRLITPPPSVPIPIPVHYSSNSEEWYTPPHIIERVVEFFDVIDLDPCSNSNAAPNVPAKVVYTKEDDGLVQPWDGRVYMNPPYGDEIGQWVRRMVELYQLRRVEAAIALLPARTDTAWFAELWRYPLCFIRGRLRFSNSPTGAPFPSVIAYLGDDLKGFARWFGDLGHIVIEHEASRDT